MWVNRKIRRVCPGNPSKLGMEVLQRMANRETPGPGQEWPLSVRVAPRNGMVVARVLSATQATLYLARFGLALWG